MKPTFKTIAILSVLVTLLTAARWVAENPCVEELKSCLRKTSTLSTPKGNQVYYMHMGIVKKMATGSEIPDTDAEVKLFISARQMHYETQMLSVYKDEKDAFTVLHPSKQIFYTNGGKIPYNDNALSQVSEYQLNMLTQCEVGGCSAVGKDEGKYKRLVLYPKPELKEIVPVKQMLFTYDPQTKNLKEIETFYLPGQSMVKEKVSIYNTDYNYKGNFPAKARDKIFNASGTLLAKYKGYKVVDSRQ